ncbi:MAG TPA: tetratricopeptide repeat protein [Flavisolibacter sp.]|jgi:predicted negative regulator of RcsB-dependent stress response|nr:tetratricopeptide repeat protein [Flavisolibacter sp.]
MAEVKQVRHHTESEEVIDRARDFWTRNGRTILIVCGAVILLGGGYLAYKYLVKEPQEQKASEAIFKAMDYFQRDSLKQALNGDGQYPGFEKVISQYGSTKPGNLAKYCAGTIYLKMGDLNKAVKYLSDFHTDSKPVQSRAYKLLADAYADQGKTSDALSNYKKAAKEFEDDEANASEYLFLAANYADQVVNNKKEAIDLYKELKQKFPRSQYALDADKYLARAGVYNVD